MTLLAIACSFLYGLVFLAAVSHNPSYHPGKVDDGLTVHDNHHGDW